MVRDHIYYIFYVTCCVVFCTTLYTLSQHVVVHFFRLLRFNFSRPLWFICLYARPDVVLFVRSAVFTFSARSGSIVSDHCGSFFVLSAWRSSVGPARCVHFFGPYLFIFSAHRMSSRPRGAQGLQAATWRNPRKPSTVWVTFLALVKRRGNLNAMGYQ